MSLCPPFYGASVTTVPTLPTISCLGQYPSSSTCPRGLRRVTTTKKTFFSGFFELGGTWRNMNKIATSTNTGLRFMTSMIRHRFRFWIWSEADLIFVSGSGFFVKEDMCVCATSLFRICAWKIKFYFFFLEIQLICFKWLFNEHYCWKENFLCLIFYFLVWVLSVLAWL